MCKKCSFKKIYWNYCLKKLKIKLIYLSILIIKIIAASLNYSQVIFFCAGIPEIVWCLLHVCNKPLVNSPVAFKTTWNTMQCTYQLQRYNKSHRIKHNIFIECTLFMYTDRPIDFKICRDKIMLAKLEHI